MPCGLKLHCLWARSRPTVKTLLPRSNAVITRHRGLSHPSLIKPGAGNTQVIRGLLFCISAQRQSLAAAQQKRETPSIPSATDRRREHRPKSPSSVLVECDQCLATHTYTHTHADIHIHTHRFACASPHIGNATPLDFLLGLLSLGRNNQSKNRELDSILGFKAPPVKHSGHSAPWSFTQKSCTLASA